MNTYDAKILADSVSPDDVRLTTLQVTFPRFILAEVNTHRMLSRNSASSRAIPPEKQIERALQFPFVPETFNRRVPGMGVGEALINEDQARARDAWMEARDHAVLAAKDLVKLDCDKSRINRLLEPFMWHTAIVTATEWSNFFALRDHPDAQPEFQIVAKLMKDAMAASDSSVIKYDEWHLPLVADAEVIEEARKNKDGIDWRFWAMVSAGRCARVSFDTQDRTEAPEDSYTRAQRLMGSGHYSPFEHVARPARPKGHPDTDWSEMEDGVYHVADVFFGNFKGWVQLRKEIPFEDDFAMTLEQLASTP